MSSVFKKNKAMILFLALAGIVSVILLVMVGITLVEWSGFRARTENARSEVQKLRTSKPAPGKENEALIREDIELYKQKYELLIANFVSTPLRPAVDAFLAELPPPRADKLTDEEFERYRVPERADEEEEEDAEEEEDVEEDAEEDAEAEETEETEVAEEEEISEEEAEKRRLAARAAVPMKKFDYDSFREFFIARFDEFCSKNEVKEEEILSMSTLMRFRSECIAIFPDGSLMRAMDKFAVEAQKLTYENINETNRLPILLAAFGMPRRVDDGISTLKKQVDDIIQYQIVAPLEKRETQKLLNAKGVISENEKEKIIGDIRDEAHDKVMTFFQDGSLNFIGGFTAPYGEVADKNASMQDWKRTDYPMVFFHWDIFSDMVNRLYDSGVVSLNKVILRSQSDEGGEEGGKGAVINLQESYEQDGDYRMYHYTLKFVCSMDALRKVLHSFDTAWQGGKNFRGRRMYIIRGIALYSSVDGAESVLDPVVEKTQNTQDRSVSSSGRTRRSNRNKNQSGENVKTEIEFKPLSEVPREEARKRYYDILKRLEEEKNPPVKKVTSRREGDLSAGRDSAGVEKMSAEEAQRYYDDYEASLDEHKRFGYASVVVGENKDQCIVYLDVDYVLYGQNQE